MPSIRASTNSDVPPATGPRHSELGEEPLSATGNLPYDSCQRMRFLFIALARSAFAVDFDVGSSGLGRTQ
jgi:hypothetical protein